MCCLTALVISGSFQFVCTYCVRVFLSIFPGIFKIFLKSVKRNENHTTGKTLEG